MSKVGPNDRCPCGSGKKYKKCCRLASAPTGYSAQDRRTAMEQLTFFIDEMMEDEEDGAFAEFWGHFLDRSDALPPDFAEMSNAVHEVWFAFDYVAEDGHRAVDTFLEQHGDFEPGERAYLEAMRRSAMHLYEVVAAVPGTSLTLRDVIEGGEVTVNERLGSKSIPRFDWIAGRVVPRGPSGGAELERGLLGIPMPFRADLASQIRKSWIGTH